MMQVENTAKPASELHPSADFRRLDSDRSLNMNLRPTLIALAASALMATSTQAAIFTFTGDTTGGPTFNRALSDFSSLSAAGTNVRYNVFGFSVSTSGDYTFLTTGSYDTFTFLYGSPFNPASPLSNGLHGNDDLLPAPFTTSGFAASLTAGSSYSYVTTGFAANNFGAYSTTIGGPGSVIPAVPEPATWALLLSGLGIVGFAAARRRSSAVIAPARAFA